MCFMNQPRFDVCVSGSGAVARALALALSGQGWRVALACDSLAQRPDDVRTYALNAHSVRLLTQLRIWPELQAHASAVHDMVIRGDDGGRLGFSAWQQHVSELAWIVDAAALERLLGEALKFAPHVRVVPSIKPGELASVPADLLAICEGKHSEARSALNVTFDRKPYGHWGVAARLKASRPHAGVARQWFRSPDVLALLPFNDPQPDHSYGLVWSVPEAKGQALLAMAPADFEQALMAALAESEPQAQSLVGDLRLTSAVSSWPLSLAQADRWVGPGWVLLGDAAHQVHPLAGQGLNLGLADVTALAQVLADARQNEAWRSAGDEKLLRRYARARWWPTQSMAHLTDGLLQLFSQDQGAVRELRNRGMGLLDQITPVKRWLVGRALDV
jgi:ubiquinone biosynthesis UbiH/UbiF/VisC/COQ6 family hydroxylase